MQNVFYSVLPIFLIAFLGSVIRRKWLKSDEFWRGLEKLSFYLLFPAVLFERVVKVDFGATEFFRLIIALSTSTLIIAIFLIIYQTKKDYDKVQFTAVFQGATRYNNYIFFALSAALFGDEGLGIVATISPYMIVITNIMAVMSFAHYIRPEQGSIAKSKGVVLIIKTVSTNPFVIASILGFTFNYLGIELNVGVDKTIQSLADSALAVGILIIGASLKFKINPEHFHQIIFTSGVKLVAMPILTFTILWMMSITGMAKSIAILFSCLPCSSSSYILSRQLGGDPEAMSSIITFTTIFSIISLSILVYILG